MIAGVGVVIAGATYVTNRWCNVRTFFDSNYCNNFCLSLNQYYLPEGPNRGGYCSNGVCSCNIYYSYLGRACKVPSVSMGMLKGQCVKNSWECPKGSHYVPFAGAYGCKNVYKTLTDGGEYCCH